MMVITNVGQRVGCLGCASAQHRHDPDQPAKTIGAQRAVTLLPVGILLRRRPFAPGMPVTPRILASTFCEKLQRQFVGGCW